MNKTQKIVALLNIVGLLFLVSNVRAQDATTTRAKKRVAVVDSVGKKVGIALSFSLSSLEVGGLCAYPPTVALEITSDALGIDETYSLGVCRSAFTGNASLFFATPDCSGQPYFYLTPDGYPSPDDMVPTAFVDGRDGHERLLIVDPSASAEVVTLLSFLHPGTFQCTASGEGTVSASRAIELLDLSTKYTPPFHLE